MRTLLIATALLSAFAAHAEPKRVSHGALKPIVLEKNDKKKDAAAPTATDPTAYQPKVLEAKPIELATPELEIKTKDISDAGLDKKLAKRMSKSTAGESNVLREPVQLKLDDPSAPASAAPTTADTANKP